MRGVWLVACWFAAVAPSAAEIFRCTGAGGEPLFTDVACPNGHPQTTLESNSVDLKLPAIAFSRPVDPPRSPRERPARPATADDAAKRRCDAARDRLDATRAAMRRGYKAASAGRLETRLRDARARVERDCAH